MNRFPDFGKDVRRPFAVAEDCYDCGEFYDGCHARPANPPTRCRDFLRLPDVMPGTYGQVFPPSRMQGRREPRLVRETVEDKPEQKPAGRVRAYRPPDQTRTSSPAANYGPGGERLCGCGALLPKRKRCCDDCRRERRAETLSRRRSRKRLPVASHAVSGVPVARAGRPSIEAGSPAHNYLDLRYPLPTCDPAFAAKTDISGGEQP
jgi:hypothetical protein